MKTLKQLVLFSLLLLSCAGGVIEMNSPFSTAGSERCGLGESGLVLAGIGETGFTPGIGEVGLVPGLGEGA